MRLFWAGIINNSYVRRNSNNISKSSIKILIFVINV